MRKERTKGAIAYFQEEEEEIVVMQKVFGFGQHKIWRPLSPNNSGDQFFEQRSSGNIIHGQAKALVEQPITPIYFRTALPEIIDLMAEE